MLTYLKRRFSSSELINEIQSGMRFGGQQESGQQTQKQQQDYKYLPEEVRKQTVEEMYMQGTAEGQSRGPRKPFPSAPSSPTKQASVAGSGYGGVGGGGGGFMNTVTGQLTKAKHLFSTETLNSIISDVKVPGVMGGSKSRVLLVIDHPLTDWAKYIHKRKIDGDWEVRVEQAQLNDISITAYPEQGCVVTVQDTRSARSQARTFNPDFVLIRQGLGAATQHYENLIIGLMFGAVPCMNSIEAVYNMRNKAWLFSNLLKIQKRVGANDFPLIMRSYQAKSQPPHPDFQLPVNVRLGGDSARECEVRVEDITLFQSLMSLANNTQRYATTEPCVQSTCEVFIQKIGPFTKAFMRKPISNPSLGSSGSTVLEKIPVTPKFNQWMAEISQLFGGLDMCAIKALQDANGDYYIQDVYGSDFLLLGDGQEEDRARIAELLVQKMEYLHKTSTAASRKASQSQVPQSSMRPMQVSAVSPPLQSSTGAQSVFSPSIPAQDLTSRSIFGQTGPQSVHQASYGMQDQETRKQSNQQSSFSLQDQSVKQPQAPMSSFSMQDQATRPQPPRQPSLSDQHRPQKPPAPNTAGPSGAQATGKQAIPGGSMDFGQSRPPLHVQQKAQSIFDSPSQALRNEFSNRDSFDRSSTASTKNTSMDFSNSPSQSSKTNFGRENEDIFGIGSTTSSAARSTTESKTSDVWPTVSNRPVREPSLDSMGRKKDAAPQPPRQPSLTNSFENRNFDTLGGSSGSSASVTSTNIFDPSTNIFQPQSQTKASPTLSTFQSQSQGRDTGSSMKFDSPSMDFGQSSFKSQHNDPWSVPPSQNPVSQPSQFSSTFNASVSSVGSAAPRPRPNNQQLSGNPDDGDDTMKNLRKTFAGIFGDI